FSPYPHLPVSRVLRALFPLSFVFRAPATTEIYTLSLHDALPISNKFQIYRVLVFCFCILVEDHQRKTLKSTPMKLQLLFLLCLRSEEHTSELQSRFDLVCRLLLEKKKKNHELKQVECSRSHCTLL